MSAYSTLEVTFRDILRVINPSAEDRRTRDQIIDELRAVVRSVESLRGATVEPFGSFLSNLFTKWGDLDLSIELPNVLYISPVGKKRKQNLLGDVLIALRRRAGWHNLQFISNARIPILVCQRSYLNISCDISINNLSGQIKSKLFLWISEIDERFRDMVLLVKEWAKAHGINDSKSGTFNSYTLSLLIIFHFQTCEPAILPPLKEIFPGNVIDELRGVRDVAMRQIEETCAQNIARYRLSWSRKRNERTLSELFISFLSKFSDFSSWAQLYGVCTYTGRWERIASNYSWLSKNYALYVEDPFEQPFNSARTVHREKLSRISETFETTRVLCSGNQNQRSLVETLVRPQVAQLLATPLNNPAGYSGSRSQIHRAVQSPSQVQNRFLNTRVDRHPSIRTVGRNVNSSRSRGDQLRRQI